MNLRIGALVQPGLLSRLVCSLVLLVLHPPAANLTYCCEHKSNRQVQSNASNDPVTLAGQKDGWFDIDTPIEQEIAAGQVHSYQVALEARQFLTLLIDSQTLDLATKLYDPSGVLVSVETKINGREALLAVTEIRGTYRLNVTCRGAGGKKGHYKIKIEELRAAAPKDQERITVERIMSEVDPLMVTASRESYGKALEKCEKVLLLVRALGDARREASVLNDLGIILDGLEDKKKALDYYHQALALHRAHGNRRGQAGTLSNIARIHDYLGNKHEALGYYEQSLKLGREEGYRQSEAHTLNNIGVLYESVGEKRKALDYYENSLTILRSLDDRRRQAGVLNNIGQIYHSFGEEQKALIYFDEALRLRRATGNVDGEANTLNSIGLVYDRLNDKQQALRYYNQSLSLWQTVGNRRGVAGTVNNLGRIHDWLGEKPKALDCYQRSLAIFTELQDKHGEAAALTGIASIHGSLGEQEKALDYLNRSLSLRRAIGDTEGEGLTLYNIGVTYRQLANRQESLDSLNRALELSRSVSYRALEVAVLQELALLERDQGQLEAARSHLEGALEIIELLRTSVSSPELRTSYLASVHDHYELYIDVLMKLHQSDPNKGYNESALQANERARARSLLEMLTEAKINFRQGVDPDLLQREKSLRELLDAKAEQRTRLLVGKHTSTQAEASKNEISQLVSEYRDTQMQIRAVSPGYAALTHPAPITIKEIQQVLDANTVLLEYALGAERSYLWVVTTESIVNFDLPKRAVIEKAAQRFYEVLSRRPSPPLNQKSDSSTITPYDVAALELSRMLLEPAAARLRKKRLLLVLDGMLNYIPFAALPAPAEAHAGQGSSPLATTHELTYLPSASTLMLLRRELALRKPAPRAVAVLADPVFDREDVRVRASLKRKVASSRQMIKRDASSAPDSNSQTALSRSAGEVGLSDGGPLPRLPFSREEAKAILVASAAGSKIALDFTASRATATDPELSQYRIVHFATHGLLNNDHPELSGLVLSLVDEWANPQNGFLRLYDIYNLNLRAELVVLSACQTALGKEVKGEGILGVTRGFMYAGAARVLASLWRVDDEATAELMKRFYHTMIKGGRTPSAALQEAQIWMQRQSRWRAPYYWAGYVLQGECN